MSVSAALRSHILADPRLSSLVYQPEEKPAGPLALPFLGGQVRPNIIEVGGGYLPSSQMPVTGMGLDAWPVIRGRLLYGVICSSAGIFSRSSLCWP